jgi:hypothetical protein
MLRPLVSERILAPPYHRQRKTSVWSPRSSNFDQAQREGQVKQVGKRPIHAAHTQGPPVAGRSDLSSAPYTPHCKSFCWQRMALQLLQLPSSFGTGKMLLLSSFMSAMQGALARPGAWATGKIRPACLVAGARARPLACQPRWRQRRRQPDEQRTAASCGSSMRWQRMQEA